MGVTTKRTVALVVLLALIGTIALGCAGAPTPAASAPTAAPQPTTAPAAEPTKAPATEPTKAPVAEPTKAPAAEPTKAPAAPAAASAADFYKGKTVTVYLGSSAGGATDIMARLFTKYLPDITGAQFVVQNETAGGGRVILNQMYSQKEADGLTLLFMPSGSIWPGYMMGEESVKYDITKFTYVGGITAGNAIMSVSATGNIKTIEDLQKTKGIKFAASNKTTLPTIANALGVEILGLDATIVTGFASSSGRLLAVQQGEVNGVTMASDTTQKAKQDGVVLPLVQIGTKRMDTYADLPTLLDVKPYDSMSDSQKKLIDTIDLLYDGKVFIAPPGAPQDRVAFLTDAVHKAFDLEGFQSEYKAAFGEKAMPFIDGAGLLKQATELAAKKGDMQVWQDIINKYVQ